MCDCSHAVVGPGPRYARFAAGHPDYGAGIPSYGAPTDHARLKVDALSKRHGRSSSRLLRKQAD